MTDQPSSLEEWIDESIRRSRDRGSYPTAFITMRDNLGTIFQNVISDLESANWDLGKLKGKSQRLSRLYSPAIARLTPLTIVATGLPSFSNCSAQY
jgi:hypothetical protein